MCVAEGLGFGGIGGGCQCVVVVDDGRLLLQPGQQQDGLDVGSQQEGMVDERVLTNDSSGLPALVRDYTYGCSSPPWGITMDHLPFDAVFR
jgi:hypothetical protein